MRNYSKYFLNDLVGTSQSLKPLIVITDNQNNILSAFSQDQEEVLDNSGNLISFVNSISKVSNVKISNDYDSKKLKINRLRCVLYNYYDLNNRLTNKLESNLISKNLYLFYKSPTTNVINIEEEGSDYDCALIYRGEISRIKHNDKTIEITAEDKTQIKIANKTVPYLSVDKLDINIRERLLSNYRDSDLTVPMTFGKVDKAFVLPALETTSDRIMELNLDFHPTSSHYKTAKIPKLHEKTPTDKPYCLYVKRDEDYIILDHDDFTVYQQGQKNSKIELYSNNFYSTDYLIPDLHSVDANQIFKLWSQKGFFQRMVQSVEAADGTVFDIAGADIGTVTDDEFLNSETVNNNGGFPKNWHRAEDNVISNNYESNFNTGLKYFNNSSGSMGKGRWILLKLTEGVSDKLLNLELNETWSGNTFLMCDWKLYQSEDGTTPNLTLITEPAITQTGFFVAPVNIDMWRDKIIPDLSLLGTGINVTQRNRYQGQLARILFYTDEQISIAEDLNLDDGSVASQNLSQLPQPNTYREAPIALNRTEAEAGSSNYWGSNAGSSNGINYNNDIIKINGTYYGDQGAVDRQTSNEADAHDNIVVFDYFPPHWSLYHNYQQGLEMNNIGFLHSVLVEDLQNEEIYASIVGRKNNFFTEQYTVPEEQEELINLSLNEIISGPDGQLPSEEDMLNAMWTLFSACATKQNQANGWGQVMYSSYGGMELYQKTYCQDTFTNIFSNPNNWLNDEYYPMYEDIILNNEDIEQITFEEFLIQVLNFYAPLNSYDDSAMTKLLTLWSDYIWKVMCSPFVLLDNLDLEVEALFILTGSGITWDEGEITNSLKFLYQEFYFNENFMKCLFAKILEYLYQRDSEYLENNDLIISWLTENGPEQYTVNNLFNNYMTGNNWNDLPNNDFDDWIENFYVYYDSLIYSINKTIFDVITPTFGWNSWSESDFNSFAQTVPQIHNISYLQNVGIFIGDLENEILNFAGALSQGEEEPPQTLTDGVIRKPSDIVMNIITNEMEFGKLVDSEVAGEDIITPDYNQFDINSIEESRQIHTNWNMGFSVNKKTEGKKLIEDILKESKSYPKFTSDGKFSLLNIKESYSYNDIDKIINIDDILSYKFEQTKREDLITSVKMFYRYDYGIEKYNNVLEESVNQIFPEWSVSGYTNYNINEIDGHRDIELKYHTDKQTVENFAKYTVMNNCNQHNIVNLKLPLSYINLEVGDKIHIPLINGEKIFNIDYSKVDFLNEQPIYPLWVIMETNVAADGISIKAYQLHYLGTDGDHGFDIPDVEYVVRGNREEFNTNNFFNDGITQIPNWNFNPNATVDSGIQIPYFDATRDGIINVNDIVKTVNYIIAPTQFSDDGFIERMTKYNPDGSLRNDPIVNVITVVALVNLILG